MIPASPIDGVREQIARAHWLVALAKEAKDHTSHFRFLIMAIYPARAAVEIMLDSATKQWIPEYRLMEEAGAIIKAYEDKVRGRIAYYDLVKTVRLHDFHRFGIIPPDPALEILSIGGPIKPKFSESAMVMVNEHGPTIAASGPNAETGDQRSLSMKNDQVFDDASGQYLGLDVVLGAYLASLEPVVADFAEAIKGKR